MAEIYLWAAASGFALVGYTLSKRLGLLDPVPRDPKARVAAYSSAALCLLKDQLVGSDLDSWDPSKVSYFKNNQPGQLWVERGALHCQGAHGQECFPIGDRGTVEFSYRQEQLHVSILAAETGGAEHSSQISLRLPQRAAGSTT